MSEERITALEVQGKNDSQKIQELSDKIDLVYNKVSNIEQGLQKQKGFISGALFVLVPIWTGIVAIAAAAWDWFVSGGNQ